LPPHNIPDQARHNACAAVEESAAKNSAHPVAPPPAYSPNMTAKQRVWKIMHEHIVNRA
jgi:transposase